jgi:hypothetical protein
MSSFEKGFIRRHTNTNFERLESGYKVVARITEEARRPREYPVKEKYKLSYERQYEMGWVAQPCNLLELNTAIWALVR